MVTQPLKDYHNKTIHKNWKDVHSTLFLLLSKQQVIKTTVPP